MKTGEGPGKHITVAVLTLQALISASFFLRWGGWDGRGGRDGRGLAPGLRCDGLPVHFLVVCALAPLPLTLFAGLAFLFGACLPDVHALRFATAGQALAAVMTLTATAAAAAVEGSAAAIAGGVCCSVEMGVAAALCWECVERLNRHLRKAPAVFAV